MSETRLVLASQKLMKRAFDQVQKRSQGTMNEASRKDYQKLVKNLPALIQVSGLAQAVAFTVSKSNELKNGAERKMILADLARCLELSSDQNDERAMKELQERIVELEDVVEYIRLTRRTQQALQYFKRFSISVLGVAEEGQ